MSTDVLELSDTELQAMFEGEKACEWKRYKTFFVPKQERVVEWECTNPAEWITVCKICRNTVLVCTPCLNRTTAEIPGRLFCCYYCDKVSRRFEEITRIVGKV